MEPDMIEAVKPGKKSKRKAGPSIFRIDANVRARIDAKIENARHQIEVRGDIHKRKRDAWYSE